MDISVQKQILREYELKREEALNILEKKKKEVYKRIPKIEVIKDEIHKLSIELLKASLLKNETERKEVEDKLKLKINKCEKEIEKLLATKGYTKKDFQLKYTCMKCLDTGYIGSSKCSCFKQEILNRAYKQYNMNKLEDENFDTFSFDYYSNDVNEKYRSPKSPKENMQNIKNIAEEFARNIDSKENMNLLFVGNTGLGKTFLSNSIAYEILKTGHTAIYQTSSLLMEFIIKYKLTYNKTKEDEENYNRLLESDLLIIDDLGTEMVNAMKFSELFNIINTRLLNNKKMVISTNLGLEKLYELYDERIVSRLIGEFKICRFYGEDIRLKKKRMIK